MKKWVIIIIAIIIVISILFMIGKTNNTSNKYNFKIYFFNAGKVDAILISNNDKYIMIDTGEESLSSEILSYFRNNNITTLDYLIITHFDKDHVGSASSVIDNINVLNVLQSNYPKESEYYNNYINSLNNKGISPITVSDNYELSLGDLNVIVNGPNKIYDKNESNNSSLIVSVYYQNTSYLFMGDAENARIKDYLSTHSESYDFIKIPYHGNYQKKLDELLETVNPKIAVITSSNKEMESSETISLLNNNNVKYYLTRNGSINIYSDGNEIIVKQ